MDIAIGIGLLALLAVGCWLFWRKWGEPENRRHAALTDEERQRELHDRGM